LLVPIFNGRDGFQFTEESFAGLHDLPMWGGAKRDLVEGCVVTVGFATSFFESMISAFAGTKTQSLMPNILFVIVLGVLSE
jgi:hypothetical protein